MTEILTVEETSKVVESVKDSDKNNQYYDSKDNLGISSTSKVYNSIN